MKNILLELKEEEYEKISDLVQSAEDTLPPMVTSIVRGHMKGTIYVDALFEMKFAVVITEFDWIFLIGDMKQDSEKESVYTLLEERLKGDANQIAIFGLSKVQAEQVQMLLKIDLRTISKVKYNFDQDRYEQAVKKFDSLSVIEVVDIDATNIKDVMTQVDGIKMFWETGKNFLNKSFGYVLYKDNEIASVCFANNAYDRFREIDIFTSEKHRGNSYAVHACSSFIDHCLKNDLKPHWETVNVNKASCRLAEKLGFQQASEYPMHVWFKSQN